jgi:phage virion morphogenesis protein
MALTLEDLGPDIMKRFTVSSDLTPLYQEIGEIILSSVARNFRSGGRFAKGEGDEYIGGPSTWLPSQRAKEQGGRTLQDTNVLSRSISYVATATGVTVGANLIYAAIHHYGGQAGRNKSLTLPARPYLVVQEEDYEEMRLAAADFFQDRLG